MEASKSMREYKGFITIFFIIFTVLFIVSVRTIDIFNTRNFLYFSSFFRLSLNSYSVYPQPTPPIFLSVLSPQLYLYNIINNIQYASDFLRLLNLFFTILAAFTLMKIVVKMTSDVERGKAVYYSFLLSPALFFVCFILNEQDVIPIFLMLVSFYLIYLHDNWLMKFAGAMLLAYASFFYYFPVILVPSMLVYEKDKKSALTLFSFFGISFLFFYTTFLRLIGWSIFENSFGAISASPGGLPLFSILNLIPGNPTTTFTPLITSVSNVLLASCIILIIFLPIIFRLLNKPIFIPVAISFVLFFLFLKIFNGDEFVWVMPLIGLPIAIFSDKLFLKCKLLLSQSYLIPVLLLFNMWGAPGYGQGTGIFYLTYQQFKDPTAIYSLVPNYILVSKILAFGIFLCLTFVLVYVLLLSMQLKGNGFSEIELNKADFPSELATNSEQLNENCVVTCDPTHANGKNSLHELPKSLRFKPKKRTLSTISLLLTFILLWVLILTPLHIKTSDDISYNGGQFPLGYFSSSTSNTLMVKNLTYNFMSNDSSIQIYNYSGFLDQTVIFTRNITNQNMHASLDIMPNYPNNVAYIDPVSSLSGIKISILNLLTSNLNYSIVSPFSASNNTTKSNSHFLSIANSGIPISNFNGTSVDQYIIRSSLNENNTYYFAFQVRPVNFSQNLILYMSSSGAYYEFFIKGDIIYFGHLAQGSNWVYTPVNQLNFTHTWNFISFAFENNSLEFFFNGVFIYGIATNAISNQIVKVDIGMAGHVPLTRYVKTYAFSGNATPLFEVPSLNTNIGKYWYLSYENKSYILPDTSNLLKITTSGNLATISSNNKSFDFQGNFSEFSFGRMSMDSLGGKYSFKELSFQAVGNSSIFLKINIILYGTPVYVMSMILYSRKIGQIK